MYKHTPALLEAGQPAQQTDHKRNSEEVEHELLLGFTHRAVMEKELGVGRKKTAQNNSGAKYVVNTLF